MSICRWCGREGDWPNICMNSRDMTDSAISGDETCFKKLAEIGWGEAGESYVRLNRAATAKRSLAIGG